MKSILYGLAAAGLAGGAAAAPLYSSDVLSFSTAQRQSMWGPGQASRAEASTFIGPSWNVSESFGDIIGGTTTLSVPNPARIAWNICDKIPFAKCGSRPPARLSKRIDTRTGAEATIATAGQIGVELGYALDGGSVAAAFDYVASIEEVGFDPSDPTRPVSIRTMSNLAGGAFDSQSPTAEAYIDVVARANLSAAMQGCLIGAGCVDGFKELIDFETRRELISIDPQGIDYFAGFLPVGASLSTPLADLTVDLEADLVTKKLNLTAQKRSTGAGDGSGDGSGGSTGDDGTGSQTVDGNGAPASGINSVLASLEVQAPEIALSKTLTPGETSISVDGVDEFLSLKADLDGLLTYAGLLPPVGVRVDIGSVLSGSVDLIDADAGPEVNVFQEFQIIPQLMVDIAFSQPVEIIGQGIADSYSGLWSALPEMRLFGDTTFSPSFFIDAMLMNRTGIQFGLGVDLTVLFGSLNLSIGPFNVDAELGPLFTDSVSTSTDAGRVALLDRMFSLEGLNRVDGDPFTVSFAQGFVSGPTPVPLPGALPLLLGGLAALGVYGRRRALAA